ncbi:MAG: isoprenylcysteine carboxyl methyltransferase family protein [Alphaproteobacteria bacterium]
MLGDAQIIVLIVLVQRVLEGLYAMHNTKRLLNRGAREAGREYFPVVMVTHLAWLAAIFFFVAPETEPAWALLGLFAVLQGARYWVISLLRGYWTLRIIVPPGGRLVRAGPYRWLAHPYYTLAMLETFLLPLVFGAWEVSVVMTAITGAVLWYQIVLEEETLEARRRARTEDQTEEAPSERMPERPSGNPA